MQKRLLLRNFVLIGSTGNAKSSTGNSLCGSEVFNVGIGFSSCTALTTHFDLESKGIRIYDTPGFNDTNMNTEQLNEILIKVIDTIAESDGKATKQIDGFLLVEKANPQLTTLKSDLENLEKLFGREALKSTIIVIILNAKMHMSGETIYKELAKMKIMENISAAKGTPFSKDWFTIWDNFATRPNQFQDLIAKASKLQPYSADVFHSMKDGIKENIKKVIMEKYANLIRKLQEDAKDPSPVLRDKCEKLIKKRDEEINEKYKVVDEIETKWDSERTNWGRVAGTVSIIANVVGGIIWAAIKFAPKI